MAKIQEFTKITIHPTFMTVRKHTNMFGLSGIFKGLLSAILIIISATPSLAQLLSLFHVDSTYYPLMKAEFYCFDSTGQFFYPDKDKIQLRENGKIVPVSDIICPPVKPPMLLSSILTLDISVSMAAIDSGPSNLDLAKAAAYAWIQGLPPGQSECALTSFNDNNYINQDFTSDRSLLRNTLQHMIPAGATDYTKALLEPVAGALQLSRAGRYKRVIVFLSDGLPNSPPPAEEIIAEAKKQNCVIFAVTLGLKCPAVLKQISEQTGGRWYENVTTIEQAREAYLNILQQSLGKNPCVVEWQADISCSGARTIEMSMPELSISTVEPYVAAKSSVAKLDVVPRSVRFGRIPGGRSKELTMKLKARNKEFTILSITPQCRTTAFSIKNLEQFPLKIPPDSVKSITIIYEPEDSSRIYCGFEIEAVPCNTNFSATGGIPGKKMLSDDITLNVQFPNGGEYLIAGSDTTIRWNGIAPDDSVTLAYSADNGQKWNIISRQATGLSYLWRVPKINGSGFLLRASQPSGDIPRPLRSFSGHSWWVNSACFSPTGKTLATTSVDNTVKLWDVESGALKRTLTGHSNWVQEVHFSPDGERVITVSDDNTAKIWDAGTGILVQTLEDSVWGINSVAYSPDGLQIISTSADNVANIIEVSHGKVIGRLQGHTHEIKDACFTPDGSKIITAGWDNQIMIWDALSRKRIAVLKGHTKPVNAVSVESEGVYLVSASDDNTLKLWDIKKASLIRTFGSHKQTINTVNFSVDGASLVTTGRGDSSANVWDVGTGSLVMKLTGHKAQVTSADYSPDGKYIITTSHDKTAKLWAADEPLLQDDRSDAHWYIVTPKLAVIPVDFGPMAVGSGRDTVIKSFLRNTGAYPISVDSIWIEQDPKNVFSIVSIVPPYTIPKHDKQSIELHCSPYTIGQYSAVIAVRYQTGDILRQALSCKGVVTPVHIVNHTISFRKTDVGAVRDTVGVNIIRNAGNSPLEISSARIAGQDEKVFSLLPNSLPQTLAPGSAAKFDLRFAPKTGGRTQDRLLIDYNGFGSPAEITLFGEGVRRDPLISVRVINRQTGALIPNADISLRDTRKKSITKEQTNESGVFEAIYPPGVEIEVSASTGKLLPDSRKILVTSDTTIELSLAETLALRINFTDDEAEVPYPYVLDSNGTETNQTWQEAIELLAEYLIQNQLKIQKFLVVGHSDDRASAEYNLRLGLQRAKFVTEELTKRGVPADIVRPSTKGKSELLVQKDGEDMESYRKRCRRIETRTLFK